jgi:predicted transcriptional regulator
MQGPLTTIDADESVDEIVTALTGGVNAVVVADGGKPIGVVTRSDLLEYLAHAR